MPRTTTVDAAKSQIRREIFAQRRERTAACEPKHREALAFSRAAIHLVQMVDAQTVASFAPLPTEPDVSLFNQIVSQAGLRLLLPEVQASSNSSKLTEPKWRENSQILAAPALAEADFVLIPAVAVDYSGTRLGRGGGWYDRALLHCSASAESNLQDDAITLRNSGALVVAAVFADEIFAAKTLPREEHDLPVQGAITERGFVSFCH